MASGRSRRGILGVDICIVGVLFDEGAARRDVVAHQHREGTLRFRGVLDGDLPQDAAGRVHGRLPELGVGHFAETLVALHGHALVGAAAQAGRRLVALGVGPAVDLLLALLHQVQRRRREIDVAVLDEVEHVAEEEGQDEAGDVRAVHIGIGHDDDLVVAELGEVHALLAVLVLLRHGDAEGGVDVADFLALEGAVLGGFLHVQDLATEREDGLDATVTALLGRTACGVTLDKEKFALLGIALGAVGQFAGHAGATHRRLALDHFAGPAGGGAGRRGEDDLLDDGLAFLGVLLQVLLHRRGRGLGDGGGGLRVAQLGLGLAFELRLGHLHGDDGGQAFAEVFRREVALELGEEVVLLGIVLQGTGQAHLEALQVRAALDGVDVVDVGVDPLAEALVVLEGDVDGDHLVGIHGDGIGDELGLACVQVVDELAEAVLAVEHVAAVHLVAGSLALAVLGGLELVHLVAQVRQRDADALVQVGQLAEPVRQGVVLIDDGLGEDGGVRMEGDRGASVGLGRGTDDLDGGDGLSLRILLDEDLPLAVDFRDEQVGQRVHAGDAHAVQAAGDLVAVLVELAARVEDRQDDLERAAVLLLVHAGRDAAAVVLHPHGIVLEDGHLDVRAEAGHRLVDTVVDDFVDKMVETSFTDVSDIHGGALADRLETFQDLDTVG